MTLTRTIEAYLQSIASKGASTATVSSYRVWLERLHAQYPDTPLAELTPALLTAFRTGLERHVTAGGAPYAAATVAAALYTLRSFGRWLVAQRHVLVNPAQGLTCPQTTSRVYDLPTSEQIALVLSRQPPTLAGRRTQAIIELLYGTGIRRGECCALNVRDVDLALGTVCLRTPKNTIPRLVPLSPTARQALETYLHEVRPQRAASDDPPDALFLDRYGRRLSAQSVRLLVRRAFAAISLSVSPHRLRHACATHLVTAGADFRQVQALLGHIDMGITVRYTHVTVADLQREHARTHPRARRLRTD